MRAAPTWLATRGAATRGAATRGAPTWLASQGPASSRGVRGPLVAPLPVLLGRMLLGVVVGAAAAFVVALLRPQARPDHPAYVAPVPPGELRV